MKKILIIITIVAVLGFLGYTLFGKSDEAETWLVSNRGSSVKVGADLLAALATLDTLRIDVDFFKDPTFKRLIKSDYELPTQPKGRTNPFAPLGTSNATASTTNTQ